MKGHLLGRGACCQMVVVPRSLEGSWEVGEASQLPQWPPPALSVAIHEMRGDGAASARAGKTARGIQLML